MLLNKLSLQLCMCFIMISFTKSMKTFPRRNTLLCKPQNFCCYELCVKLACFSSSCKWNDKVETIFLRTWFPMSVCKVCPTKFDMRQPPLKKWHYVCLCTLYVHVCVCLCVCVCVRACVRACIAGVSRVQPPTINSSLVVDKVLVGESVTLRCFIHMSTSSGVEITWASSADSQVQLSFSACLLHHGDWWP